MKSPNQKWSALLTAFFFASASLLDTRGQQTGGSSISFQGALNGPDGKPLPNGQAGLVFKFYDAPTGGLPLGTTNVAGVSVTGGIASTAIPVDPAWFNGQVRYLGISIDKA